MASAGTSLEDLASQAPLDNDGDLVQKILADMNTGGNPGNAMMSAQPPALPPAPSARAAPAMTDPNPNTMIHHAMDPATPTAHMIGGQHPSPADFAALMPNQGHFGPPSMGAPYYPGAGAGMMPVIPPAPPKEDGWFTSSKTTFLKEVKTPLLVAIIVFVVSLPLINTMLGLYFPRLLRIGGDLTTVGLLVKSVGAGVFFWILQRVLVPLVAP